MLLTNDQAREVGIAVEEIRSIYDELCRHLHDLDTCRTIWVRIDERHQRIKAILGSQ